MNNGKSCQSAISKQDTQLHHFVLIVESCLFLSSVLKKKLMLNQSVTRKGHKLLIFKSD